MNFQISKKTLNAILDIHKKINDEIFFTCTKKGIEIKATDPSHTEIISFFIPGSELLNYEITEDLIFGFEISRLKNVTKLKNGNDNLDTEYDDIRDHIIIKDNHLTYDLAVLDPDGYQPVTIPTLEYRSNATITTKNFYESLKAINKINDHAKLVLDEKDFTVYGECDDENELLKFPINNLGIEYNDSEKYFISIYGLRMLYPILIQLKEKRVQPINVSLKTNFPLKITGELRGVEILYLLAPRVENGGSDPVIPGTEPKDIKEPEPVEKEIKPDSEITKEIKPDSEITKEINQELDHLSDSMQKEIEYNKEVDKAEFFLTLEADNVEPIEELFLLTDEKINAYLYDRKKEEDNNFDFNQPAEEKKHTEKVNIFGVEKTKYRCPECNRGLKNNNFCMIHGTVKGYDLSQADDITKDNAIDLSFLHLFSNHKIENKELTYNDLNLLLGIDKNYLKGFLQKNNSFTDNITNEQYYKELYGITIVEKEEIKILIEDVKTYEEGLLVIKYNQIHAKFNGEFNSDLIEKLKRIGFHWTRTGLNTEYREEVFNDALNIVNGMVG